MSGNLVSISNGRITCDVPQVNPIAYASPSNAWSSSESNGTNAWRCDFSSGAVNNNKKNNTYTVRAVAALDEEIKIGWLKAYEDCCASKKSSVQCDAYRANYADDLVQLMYEIYNGGYRPSTSTCFCVSRPKVREIFAAAFRDRVVQHWITQRIEPLLEQRFHETGDVSYNCRKGYGTLAAVSKLQADMSHYGYGEELYVGRFDVRSFFMSVDVEILWSLLEPFVIERYHGADKDVLLRLLRITVFHRPQTDCHKQGDQALFDILEPRKSLFHSQPNIGMAIGNITSQLLCNLYMSFFDEWVLSYLRSYGIEDPTRHYIRFVDDFVVHSVPAALFRDFRRAAEEWLRDNLRLTLHPDKVYIQPQRHGIKFVGSVLMPGRVYLGNRTVGGLHDALHRLDVACAEMLKAPSYDRAIRLTHCIQSVNSYLGFMAHTSSYNIRLAMVGGNKNITLCCYYKNKHLIVEAKNKYKPKNYLHGMDYQFAVAEHCDRKECVGSPAVHAQHTRRTARRRMAVAGRPTTRRRPQL